MAYVPVAIACWMLSLGQLNPAFKRPPPRSGRRREASSSSTGAARSWAAPLHFELRRSAPERQGVRGFCPYSTTTCRTVSLPDDHHAFHEDAKPGDLSLQLPPLAKLLEPKVAGSSLSVSLGHRWALNDRGPALSTPVEKVTNVAGENVTPGGGDEPLVRRLLLCSCSLSLGG